KSPPPATAGRVEGWGFGGHVGAPVLSRPTSLSRPVHVGRRGTRRRGRGLTGTDHNRILGARRDSDKHCDQRQREHRRLHGVSPPLVICPAARGGRGGAQT